MLLRFRVANHRSIRDEQELSLVEVPKRGKDKPRASEVPATVPVAGIYGSNASGKSNVLDALRWMRLAVRDSYTHWEPDEGVPRDPFALDEDAKATPSFFEVDVVSSGVRFTYGFEVDDDQVAGEWLYAYPHGRPQRWFERDAGGDGEHEYRFGRSLKGELEQIRRLTRRSSLYLSVAASNGHDQLFAVYTEIVRKIAAAQQDNRDQSSRMRRTANMLHRSDLARQVFRLIALADLGVTGWRTEEKKTEDEMREARRKSLERGRGLNISAVWTGRLALERGSAEKTQVLDLSEESDGTLSWMSLVGPLVEVLQSGALFLVDEIDSSLHPMLSSTMIRMFKDPGINPRGAQLVFASHDTTLLGSMLDRKLLGRDEVWFTEKDAEGATQLFSLAEFHPRDAENTERGYLQGRYGAVPYVDFEEIRSVFADLHREPDEPSSASEAESRAAYAET
ncbi:AAA family ATPase [Streptomonospora litoralis]|uniref:ATPase AAA-type core domain-containing protein n=1 Tax=Streptomonospora litoralis TaxID=2498135 RepID=A0A4P6Q0S3_9ACTN|nr:ATP-binding protein [Streptomonospora litoralis]QBI53670.1 hypothetical protein EKD16_09380 [Streptomonospora litoralis]